MLGLRGAYLGTGSLLELHAFQKQEEQMQLLLVI